MKITFEEAKARFPFCKVEEGDIILIHVNLKKFIHVEVKSTGVDNIYEFNFIPKHFRRKNPIRVVNLNVDIKDQIMNLLPDLYFIGNERVENIKFVVDDEVMSSFIRDCETKLKGNGDGK